MNKGLFVQVVNPADWTCSAFRCVFNDRLVEQNIARIVIIHRNYLWLCVKAHATQGLVTATSSVLRAILWISLRG